VEVAVQGELGIEGFLLLGHDESLEDSGEDFFGAVVVFSLGRGQKGQQNQVKTLQIAVHLV